MWQKIRPFVVSIALALGVGLLSAFFSRNTMVVYQSLVKPELAPPPIVFPIVWTILYILMGISAALVYQSEAQERDRALVLYGAQLIVNFFWSILFFGAQARLLAFFWLLLLVWLVVSMVVEFWRSNRVAGILQIPYLVWLFFAGYLNLSIYLLNR